MGAGLIVMGLYPILQPLKIKNLYGYILLAVGVIKLLVGFVDINNQVVQIYASLYYQVNELVSLVVIAAIAYVVVNLALESLKLYYQREEEEKDIIEETKDE